ncbi:alpha/beta fold hydrolase [Massilia sp. W12]|uniref:alpha/beta hydrolase n=1 Tax=Massilia sp. W12 TaxID=3126507 RepID=UPI0030CF7259
MIEKNITIKTPDNIMLDSILTTPLCWKKSDAMIILVHGITADLNESGTYEKLARRLASKGLASIRFSFRGHGNSSLASEYVTISGECIDLLTILSYCKTHFSDNISIVASSFGAVPLGCLCEYLNSQITCLVLLNPVIDTWGTFISPTLDWGIKNFTGPNIENIYINGFFLIDDYFRIGVVLWEELHQINPKSKWKKFKQPILIIHGNQDSYVSYETSRELFNSLPTISFETISGADHGFEIQEDETYVLLKTEEYLLHHHFSDHE